MVVPRSRVNEMVTYLHDLHNEIDIRIKSFGHAGDGNLHAYILKDDLSDEEWEKRMSAAMEKIYQKAHELEEMCIRDRRRTRTMRRMRSIS